MAVHRISGDTKGAVVDGAVGDEIVVTLTEMAGAGYQWHIDSAAPSIVEVLPEVGQPAVPTAPGANNVREIRFRIVSPGQTRIDLSHRRPWEGATSANKTLSFGVRGR